MRKVGKFEPGKILFLFGTNPHGFYYIYFALNVSSFILFTLNSLIIFIRYVIINRETRFQRIRDLFLFTLEHRLCTFLQNHFLLRCLLVLCICRLHGGIMQVFHPLYCERTSTLIIVTFLRRIFSRGKDEIVLKLRASKVWKVYLCPYKINRPQYFGKTHEDM